MNKKGMTLVELLAVITILGILSSMAVVAFSWIINRAHDEYYDTLKHNVISAAKSYYGDHRVLLPTEVGESGKRTVSLEELKTQNYIKNVTDHTGKNQCSGEVVVIRENSTNYKYSIDLVCNGDHYN